MSTSGVSYLRTQLFSQMVFSFIKQHSFVKVSTLIQVDFIIRKNVFIITPRTIQNFSKDAFSLIKKFAFFLRKKSSDMLYIRFDATDDFEFLGEATQV